MNIINNGNKSTITEARKNNTNLQSLSFQKYFMNVLLKFKAHLHISPISD